MNKYTHAANFRSFLELFDDDDICGIGQNDDGTIFVYTTNGDVPNIPSEFNGLKVIQMGIGKLKAL